MVLALRMLLIAGSALLLAYILKKVRGAKIQAEDGVIWIVLSIILALLAIFPSISFVLADWLHIQSPSNFVFLAVIAVLVVKVFLSSMEIASLKTKLNTVVQELALKEKTDKE